MAWVSVISGPSFAQDVIPPSVQEPIQHDVSVTLKLIQVYVTDKAGRAVTDLTREDFILSSDGRQREITDFEKHVFLGPLDEEAAQPADRRESPTPLLGRKLYFLIDFARNDFFGMRKTRAAALHFLETQVQPTDEIALLSYRSFAGIVLHENLTLDHGRIVEALQDIEDIPGYGMGGGFPLEDERGLDDAVGRVELRGGLDEMVGAQDFDREHLKDKTYEFTLAMQELAKALQGTAGFKNIIFFSSGVSRSLLYDLDDSRIRHEYENMIKEFASSNCPIFSVNADGQRAFLRDQNDRGDHALRTLSERSGGRYFHDVDQEKKIAAEIQDMTGNFYVLGFAIEETQDGKYHDIKVEVQRPGCRVHAQSGYYNPKPFRKYDGFEKQLHLFDLAFGEKSKFLSKVEIPVVALTALHRKETNAVLLAEIFTDRMEEVLGEETEMVALVLDEKRDVVGTQKGVIKKDYFHQPVFHPYALFPLPQGEYTCRIVFRNLETGRGAVGSTDLVVPEIPPDAMTLFPPLLLFPDKTPFYLRFSKADLKERDNEEAPLKGVFPSLETSASPVLEVMNRGVSRLQALVQLILPSETPSDIQLEAAIFERKNGEEMAVPLSVLEKRDSEATAGETALRRERLFLELEFPDLPPGFYDLLLKGKGAASELKAVVWRTIEIK